MPRARRTRPYPGIAAAIVGVLALAATYGLTRVRYAAPAPLPAHAPDDRFSAVRARDVLRVVLEGGEPHRVGTAANEAVRGRIVARLEELGLEPEVRPAFSCGPKGTCAEVKNVLVRVPGREGPAILLMAHFDTAAVAPGASDDGLGVAAMLEIARALTPEAPLRHPVLLLFTDGEEGGLLGAQAFVDAGKPLDEVGVAINLDGRGTDGPSIMYETGPGNQALVRVLARSLSRPVASSLFAAFYRRMPTDTDFTPLRERGVPGLNFAYVGDIFKYHTPLDTLENLDDATLQHQGQNALETVRGLLALGVPEKAAGDAVFVDIQAAWLLWWPWWISPLLALAAVALLRTTVADLQEADLLGPGDARRGAVAWVLLLAGGAAAGAVVTLILQALGSLPGWFVAHPAPAVIALWGAAVAVLGAVTASVGSPVGFWSAWCGIWGSWATVALVLSLAAPAASAVFVLPALMAGAAGAFARTVRVLSESAECALAGLVPVVVTGVLWIPILWFQFQAVGFAYKAPITTLACLLLSALLPLLITEEFSPPPAIVALGGALLTIGGTLASLAYPTYTPASPQRASVVLHQHVGDADAQIHVGGFFGPPPSPMDVAADFSPDPVRPHPWSSSFHPVYVAPAPAFEAEPPRFEVVATEETETGRKVRGRLTSPRGALLAGLLLPPEAKVVAVRVAGKPVPRTDPRSYDWANGWQSFTCLSLPLEGAEYEVELEGRRAVNGIVFDRSLTEVTDSMRPVVEARPRAAVPSHYGDGTVITREVNL